MSSSTAGALLAFALIACAQPGGQRGGPAAGGPRFRAVAPGAEHERGRVEVSGAAAGEQLAIVVDWGEAVIDLLGETGWRDGTLFFEPRFPFTLDHEYTARLTRSSGACTDFVFSFPGPTPVRTTRVSHVEPSDDVLPENLLKFYLHFSAPMRRGEAYEHVRLVSNFGAESEDAFLDVEPELWDPSNTRLTLFIEPGRIKRGLALRDELGPVLEAGHTYRLEIDAEWRDARGARLAAPFVKTFLAERMDTDSPEPARWRIEAPLVGTRTPLRVALNEPLDAALLQRCLHVEQRGGERVPGTAHVVSAETEWFWEPTDGWRAGDYELVVDSILEDLAGNSVGRPFEVLLGGEPSADAKLEPVRIPFEVRPLIPR